MPGETKEACAKIDQVSERVALIQRKLAMTEELQGIRDSLNNGQRRSHEQQTALMRKRRQLVKDLEAIDMQLAECNERKNKERQKYRQQVEALKANHRKIIGRVIGVSENFKRESQSQHNSSIERGIYAIAHKQLQKALGATA